MAVRTISDAGGNWNSTATWDEGVVPTTSDNVVAKSTSGQVTVTVNANVGAIDLNNYISTLTINSGVILTVSGAGGNFLTLYATASYAGTGQISVGANNTISGNNTDISPISLNLANTPVNLSSAIGVQNLTSPRTSTTTVQRPIFSPGPFEFSVKGNLLTPSAGGGLSMRSGKIIFNGTGSQSIGRNNLPSDQAIISSCYLVFNHSGTVTFNTVFMVSLDGISGTFVDIGMEYISGTIAGTKDFRYTSSAVYASQTSKITLDLKSTTGWNFYLNWTQSPQWINLELLSDLNFDTIEFGIRIVITTLTNYFIRVTGTGALKGGKLIMPELAFMSTTNIPYSVIYNKPTLQLSGTASHMLSEIVVTGIKNPPIISSQTASTTAYLGVSGTSSVINASFIDIDATSGPFNVFKSSLTRTSGITNYDTLGGGGGTGSAGGNFIFFS